ncbi:unnamed protein product [Cuscuta epithymum]|uniref:Uncharacterized protein n=1 Tax=Cuscuta epithymum TaxID=186058 RepID=A0AAV0C705_9ASTE|nr:unnamed protein product [Cuscuta epithymum]
MMQRQTQSSAACVNSCGQTSVPSFLLQAQDSSSRLQASSPASRTSSSFCYQRRTERESYNLSLQSPPATSSELDGQKQKSTVDFRRHRVRASHEHSSSDFNRQSIENLTSGIYEQQTSDDELATTNDGVIKQQEVLAAT